MKYTLLIGSYTKDKDSPGIYQVELDKNTGMLHLIASIQGGENPSFLAIKDDDVYAVNEQEEKAELTSLRWNSKRELQFINTTAIPGAGACHLIVHPEGSHLFVANYLGGDYVCCVLGDEENKPEVTSHVVHEKYDDQIPHCHCMVPSANGLFVIGVDLGLDRIDSYSFNTKDGLLQENQTVKLEKGCGPRHFTFDEKNQHGYLITEYSNEVVVFDYDETNGKLTQKQALSTLPPDFSGESYGAAIKFSPNHRFLYVSNRGVEGIAAFKVDKSTGLLTHSGHYSCAGSWPRDFSFSPDGQFVIVANQRSHNVVCMPVCMDTGAIGEPVSELKLHEPTCVVCEEE